MGAWFIGLMVGYVALLICVSRIASRKITSGEGFFSGGSSFGVLYIFACVSAFWGAAAFISVLELGYTVGISAMWYGIATIIMLLMIGFILVPKFKSMGMVTFSGILGDKYGDVVRAISSLIIGLTFPMFAIATLVGAASALSVVLNWPIWLCVVVTSLIILAYVLLGGMYAVGITQLINMITMLLSLCVALFVVFTAVDLNEIANLPAKYMAPFTVGKETILVWIFNFITNAVIAQAVIQMIMACKDYKVGKRGTVLAALGIIPLTLIPAFLGMAAAILVPGVNRGLVAFAQLITQNASAPIAAVIFLGVWAAGLAWAAPCLFSGGTSLGKDFIHSINKNASSDQLVRYGGIATALLTGVLIILGFMRSEQAAWWNIFAFNLRNSAIFAPTIAALAWPVATRRATIITMVFGCLTGFIWYYLGNFDPKMFFLKVHPMWVGMTAGILLLTIASLIEERSRIIFIFQNKFSIYGFISFFVCVICIYVIAVYTDSLKAAGFIGNLIFLSAMALFTSVIIFTHYKTEFSMKEKSSLVLKTTH